MMKKNRFIMKIVAPSEPKVRHYKGLPPQLTGGADSREQLAVPILLLIEQEADGASLYRYDADGRIVGDTFHETLDDARRQAHLEYGKQPADWEPVPDNVEDPFIFGTKD